MDLRVFKRYQVFIIFIDKMELPLESDLKPPSRRPVLIWLIISQALAVASLFFWLLMAGLSVMAFNSRRFSRGLDDRDRGVVLSTG